MIYKIFSVFDKKANCYAQPFFMRSVPEAARVFEDLRNEIDHPFNKHPEDYVLYEVGTWTEENGQLKPQEAGPSAIIKADQIIDKNAPFVPALREMIKDTAG